MTYIEPIKWKCTNCESEQINDPLRTYRPKLYCICGRVMLFLTAQIKKVYGEKKLYKEIKNEN